MIISLSNTNRLAIIDDGWEEDVGCQKWALDSKGYAITRTLKTFPEYRQIYLHNLIMGEKPSFQVDHINGNRLDNRTANLRHVTVSQQRMNSATRSDNTSGCKGVSRSRHGGWLAYIHGDGHYKYLGYFKTLEEACTARKEAEQFWHGKYARKT